MTGFSFGPMPCLRQNSAPGQGAFKETQSYQIYHQTLRFIVVRDPVGPFMGWFCMLYHLEMSIGSSDQYVHE